MGFNAITNMIFLIVAICVIVIVGLFVGDIMSGISWINEGDDSFFGSSESMGIYDDYPEYGLNRSNIEDAIKYNPSVQEFLRPYSHIGVEIGIDVFTLHLENGTFVDLTRGVEPDVDFTARTNRETFKKMVADARHKDIGHLITLLIDADVPLEVKSRALNSVRTLT